MQRGVKRSVVHSDDTGLLAARFHARGTEQLLCTSVVRGYRWPQAVDVAYNRILSCGDRAGPPTVRHRHYECAPPVRKHAHARCQMTRGTVHRDAATTELVRVAPESSDAL